MSQTITDKLKVLNPDGPDEHKVIIKTFRHKINSRNEKEETLEMGEGEHIPSLDEEKTLIGNEGIIEESKSIMDYNETQQMYAIFDESFSSINQRLLTKI